MQAQVRFVLALAVLLALPAAARSETVLVIAERGVNVRAKPDLASDIVSKVEKGTELEVIYRSGEWYEIVVPESGEPGYVHRSAVREIQEGVRPDPGATPGQEERSPEGGDPDRPGPTGGAGRQATAVADAAPARRPRFWSRFTVSASGALATAATDSTAERRFTDFAEEGRLDTVYTRGAGPAFELRLEYPVGRRLAVEAAFGLLQRDGVATYTASIPHPLYLGRPRTASAVVSDLSYGERAVHLDLVYRHLRGRLSYAVYAGPSWVSADFEQLDPVQYRHSFPFDDVEVTFVPRHTARGSALGFNGGAGVDYRFSDRLGVQLLVRYHRASVDLDSGLAGAGASPVTLKAGGLQVGTGIKLFFRPRSAAAE